ncbi:MAG TPA: STAS domain-containing protein [Caulobacteraceae bacterium]|nr:STAS domain-containing protein [Caulobacteraceae bacterium]
MSIAPVEITLQAILDLTAARSLAGELLARRGAPLSLDASKVERLGALCLQVLLSARVTWMRDGQPLTIKDVSPAFEDQFQRFGANAHAFARGASS